LEEEVEGGAGFYLEFLLPKNFLRGKVLLEERLGVNWPFLNSYLIRELDLIWLVFYSYY